MLYHYISKRSFFDAKHSNELDLHLKWQSLIVDGMSSTYKQIIVSKDTSHVMPTKDVLYGCKCFWSQLIYFLNLSFVALTLHINNLLLCFIKTLLYISARETWLCIAN